MSGAFDILNANIYEAFVAEVLDWLTELAAAKAVNITRISAERMAHQLADRFDLAVPLRFMRDEEYIVTNVGRHIWQALDLHMAEQFADLYFATFGAAPHPSAHLHAVRVILNLFRDHDTWPALDVSALIPYLDTCSDNLVTDWGECRTITFHRGFVLDRANGPAIETFHDDGRYEQTFWLNGVPHRDPADGPATISRQTCVGPILSEHYVVDGRLHRDGGLPAVIWYEPDGTVIGQQFFTHGEEIEVQRLNPSPSDEAAHA